MRTNTSTKGREGGGGGGGGIGGRRRKTAAAGRRQRQAAVAVVASQQQLNAKNGGVGSSSWKLQKQRLQLQHFRSLVLGLPFPVFFVTFLVLLLALLLLLSLLYRLDVVDLDLSPEIHLQALIAANGAASGGESGGRFGDDNDDETLLELSSGLFDAGTADDDDDVDESGGNFGGGDAQTKANERIRKRRETLRNLFLDVEKDNRNGNSSSTSSSAGFVVFYHVYLPPSSRRGIRNAHRIVAEQLDQIGAAIRRRSRSSTNTTSTATGSRTLLFYTTVGGAGTLPPGTMRKLCSANRLRCVHLRHSISGFEELTLEPLYDFCSAFAFDDDDVRVVYIHSKGSFHSQRGDNDRWRRHMMSAVTSPECLSLSLSPSPSSTLVSEPKICSVCGLLFSPLWTFMYPGNFWTARCSYVRKLLPPRAFRRKMGEIADEVLRLRGLDEIGTELFSVTSSGGYTGVERYAAEHWIASHPDVTPCDMSKTADLEFWWKSDQTVEVELEFAAAPRHPMLDAPWFRLNQSVLSDLLSDDRRSRREYFLLSGFLFKWYRLYSAGGGGDAANVLPPCDSWIWRWFKNRSTNATSGRETETADVVAAKRRFWAQGLIDLVNAGGNVADADHLSNSILTECGNS